MFMTSDYLKALKLKKNLTNQELSDLSGVPVGTINRIMANQTDNPSFQTVCDIVIALDGSLDELAGIRPKKDNEAENAKYTPEIEAIYKQMIHSKDKWIFRLFVFSCVIVAFIVFLLIFDLLNPNIGFFRR